MRIVDGRARVLGADVAFAPRMQHVAQFAEALARIRLLPGFGGVGRLFELARRRCADAIPGRRQQGVDAPIQVAEHAAEFLFVMLEQERLHALRQFELTERHQEGGCQPACAQRIGGR